MVRVYTRLARPENPDQALLGIDGERAALAN